MVDTKSLIETAVKLERHSERKQLSLLNSRNKLVEIKDSPPIYVEVPIRPILELGAFKMPYSFEAGFIEEGTYRGVFLPAEELIIAKDTFFYEDENFQFYIVYWDHNNQFKIKPSAKERIGKITKVVVSDKSKGSLVAYGILTNQDAAMSVEHGVNTMVSVRIAPKVVRIENGRKVGRQLVFQELSIVSIDEYKGSYIKGA